MATDLTPVLTRIEELAIDAGFQLVKPPHYEAEYDCVRVDTIGGWYMAFDVDMFQFPADIWERVVRADCEKLRVKMGLDA